MTEEAKAPRKFIYQTAWDERVCPWCAPLDGTIVGEDIITSVFPHARQIDDKSWRVNLHYAFPFLLGECRCELHEHEEPATPEKPEGAEDEEMSDNDKHFAYWKGARAIYSLRSPDAAARYGTRQFFQMAGLAGLGSILAPMVFFLIMPAIKSYMDLRIEQQIRAQQKKLRAQRSEEYALMYRQINQA